LDCRLRSAGCGGRLGGRFIRWCISWPICWCTRIIPAVSVLTTIPTITLGRSAVLQMGKIGAIAVSKL